MRNYDDYSKWTGDDWYAEKSQFDAPFGWYEQEEEETKSYFYGESVGDMELEQAREIIRKAMSIPEVSSIAEAADMIDRYSLLHEIRTFGEADPAEVLRKADRDYYEDPEGSELTIAVNEWNENTSDDPEEDERIARIAIAYAADIIRYMIDELKWKVA